MRGTGLFKFGRYWVDRIPGSPNLYRFWYDPRTGEVIRRTLKTANLEQAKNAVGALVLSEGSGQPEQPESVMISVVMQRYYVEHIDHTRSRFQAHQAGDKLMSFLGAQATVGEFRAGKQLQFMRSLLGEGYAVATIARMMSAINAAFNHAKREDADGRELLLRAPRLTYSDRAVAAALGVAEPTPKNWHPDLDMIATFLNGLTPEEETLRRFAIIKLAFACRSEAAFEAGPFQLDRRYRLLKLNPEGRRQTKKHRPTLPVPAQLWPVLTEEWTGETFVGASSKLQMRWFAARERIGLPKEMIPNSLRHFMATELRHAHLRYGVPRVPADECEMWLGHRRQSVHNSYGAFEPDYLATAKRAVEAILDALNARLNQPVFRQLSRKSTRKQSLQVPISRYTPRASRKGSGNG